MRKTFGIGFIVLGFACLIGAFGFVLYNRFEAKAAQISSETMLNNVQQILQTVDEKTDDELKAKVSEISDTVPIIQVDGCDCVGILTIPVLELELPILAGWDYDKLKIAPCQYFGNCYEKNFVIAAHNYPSHFGRLSEMKAGDVLVYTDMAGNSFLYETVLLETLPATATEEMITSGFDLSLYTCTPGGQNRVTLRCVKSE